MPNPQIKSCLCESATRIIKALNQEIISTIPNTDKTNVKSNVQSKRDLGIRDIKRSELRVQPSQRK